jgi:hypothetical protein
MEDPAAPESLDKVYAEAGQWLRMCNTLLWSMASILIPISIGCVGLAQKYPVQKTFLAAASIFRFAFWVYVSNIYKITSAQAREVLMAIEKAWKIPGRMALYNIHGHVGKKWYSLFHVQVLGLLLLVVLWAILLPTLK